MTMDASEAGRTGSGASVFAGRAGGARRSTAAAAAASGREPPVNQSEGPVPADRAGVRFVAARLRRSSGVAASSSSSTARLNMGL